MFAVKSLEDDCALKPKCEPNATICHETVRFDGGPIYCYQPMPCRVHGVEKRVEPVPKCDCMKKWTGMSGWHTESCAAGLG
jgi:hypothetical protein